MALPLNTRTALGNFGLGKSTLGACALALLDGPLLGLVLLLLLLLLLFRFRKTLPRWNAVASRAICPMSRWFCVVAITASCNCCGNSVSANSAKARENFDSCGRACRLDQPHNRRKASSTRSRQIRSRVVGRFRTALARKAVARAARSLAGRPVAARRAPNIRSKGAKEMTAASNCICPFSGPTEDRNSGNNSSCNM